MPQFDGFVYWAFCGLIGWCAVSVVSFLRELNRSIHDLNLKLEVLLTKHSHVEIRISKTEEMIDDHENRIQLLEEQA